jgi:predicted nicotinamide N-methyase
VSTKGGRRDPAPSFAKSGPELIRQLTERFDTTTSAITLSDGELDILHPKNADDLINEEDFVRDERMPYWADIWPSSLILAELLVASNGKGVRLLELGCGVGVVSAACAKAGFSVLATDYYDEALAFARANAWQNAGVLIETRLVDWRDFPRDIGSFDMVVASDVLYEKPNAALMADALATTISHKGFGLVADPGRIAAGTFLEQCAHRALVVERSAQLPFEAGAIKQTIDVYRITRPGAGS